MSKPESGLLSGTSGILDFYGNAESVIANRAVGLDLQPHPIKNKQLSAKQRAKIKSKIDARTATREEYKRYQSKPLEFHHTYSAIEYPHLANMGEVIYPATHDEHFKGWHGGNYKKSKPGKRIRRFREF